MLWGLSLLIGTVLAWMPSATAHADSAGVTSALSWVRLPGTEACLTAPELAARVEKLLDRPVFVAPTEADLSIEGRVEQVAERLQAHVVVADRDGAVLGTRLMEDPSGDCHALAEKVALVIALTVRSRDRLVPLPHDLVLEGDNDPAEALLAEIQSAPRDSDAPQPEQTPKPAPAAASTPRTHRPRMEDRDDTHSTRYTLGLGAVGSYGELPTLGLGPMALVRAELSSHWALDVRATYQWSLAVDVNPFSVKLHKAYATLLLWWTPSPSERGDIALGLGVDAGSNLVFFDEQGTSRATANQFTAGIQGGLRMRAYANTSLAFGLELMALIAPWPTDVGVEVNNVVSPVYQGNTVVARLALVLEWKP